MQTSSNSLFAKILLFIFFSVPFFAHSQADTEFWLTIPELTQTHGVEWGNGGMIKHVVVSAMERPATVTASVPADPSFKPIVVNVAANTTERINFEDFNTLLELIDYDIVTKQGILIESSDTITAYLESMEVYNPDVFTLKGRHSLGTDFYVPFQNQTSINDFGTAVQAYCSIDIVATEDDTDVTIIPTDTVAKQGGGFYLPGEEIKVSLNRGESFSARSYGFKAEDHLGGSRVISNKPIAVISKDDSVLIGSSFDLIGDQIVPITRTGRQYIVMKASINGEKFGDDNADEYAFVIPTENGTTISVNGSVFGTFDAGENVAIPISETSTIIESSGNDFYCFHIAGFKGEFAGAVLPPTDECSGTMRAGFSYSYGTFDNDPGKNQSLYIMLMVEKGAENAFSLDGGTASWIDPIEFTEINEFWSAVKIGPLNSTDLALGSHVLTNSKGLFHMGYINATGSGALYGYFSDFESSEIQALANKTNDSIATYCVGENIRLRVDGGVSYSWRAYDANDNSIDRSQYILTPDKYSTEIDPDIPAGEYIFEVSSLNACGGDPVIDLIYLNIIPAPEPQLVDADFCESEIGSLCKSGIDLTAYFDQLAGDTGYVVTSWKKEVYDDFQIMNDFETEEHATVTINSSYVDNIYAADNPLIDGVNSSEKVFYYAPTGNKGDVNIKPISGYNFDFSKGDIVKVKVLNDRGTETCFPRTFTLNFIKGTDTISASQELVDCNEWVDLTFDFSSANSDDIYDFALLQNTEDWMAHEYYIDDFRKYVDYRVDEIQDPSDVKLCGTPDVFVTMENYYSCKMTSTFSAKVTAGEFDVENSPQTATICEEPGSKEIFADLDLSEYSSSFGSAGLEVIKWEGFVIDSTKLLEDFEDNDRKITWGGWINIQDNPDPTDENLSANCWSTGEGTTSFTFNKAINLADGYAFSIDYYLTADQFSSDDFSMDLQLQTEDGTVISSDNGPFTFAHDDNSVWVNLVYDFSSNADVEDITQADIILVGMNTYYIDNIKLVNAPIRTEFEEGLVKAYDGAIFYATVQNAEGCVVAGELNVDMKVCGPPVVDTTMIVCEEVKDGGSASKLNISFYNDIVRDDITENKLEWFSDKDLSVKVADSTSVTANDGDIFYAKVTNDAGMSDTAKLTIEVRSLPELTFPDFDPVCMASDSIEINLADPAGGIYKSESEFFNTDSLFEISKAGKYDIRYVYSDSIGCTDSVDQTLTVNGLPEINFVTTNLFYCGTSDIDLEVEHETDATYEWYKDGVLLSETNNILQDADSGYYQVVKTLASCTADLDSIHVVGYDSPPYEYLGADTICFGNQSGELAITIEGATPWELTYEDKDGVSETVTVPDLTYVIPFTATEPGDYKYTVRSITDGLGCKAEVKSESLIYSILPAADRPWIDGIDTSLCVNEDAVDLTAYVDITDGIFSSEGVDGNTFDPEISGDGKFTVFYNYEFNGICSAQDSIIMDVHSLPVPEFDFDSVVCISVTAYELAIVTNDSIATYAFTGTGVASGQFDPETATAGTHTITYTFESIHECSSEKTVDILVNPLPEPQIGDADRYSFCISEPEFVVPATPAGGELSGTGINGDSFSPADAGQGTYTIEYYVKDENGCENTDTANYTVLYTEPVESKHFTFVNTKIPETISVEALSGADVNWYESETGTAVINTGVDFVHGETAIVEKSYWVAQSIDDCESLRSEIQLSIIDCETPAPAVADPDRNICLYSDDQIFTAETVTPDAEVRWYNTGGELLHTGKEYTLEVTPDIYDGFQFYAVQDTGCQGASIDLSIGFIEPVSPELEHSGDVCESDEKVSLSETSGLSSLYWFEAEPAYPAVTASSDGSGLVYESSASSAGSHSVWAVAEVDGCLSEASSIAFNIKSIPDVPELTENWSCLGEQVKELSAQGTDIKWYESAGSSSVLSSGETYTPDENSADIYTYYATQTIDGCESSRASVEYEIRSLPDAPAVYDETICSNYDLPSITARSEFDDVSWYKTETSSNSYKTGKTIQLEDGDTKLYVSQFGNGCESERSPFVLTIIQQPPLPVLHPKTVCESDDNIKLEAETTVEWYSDSSASVLSKGTSLSVTDPDLGEKSYYARQKSNNCYSYFSETILTVVPQPVAPSVSNTEAETCDGDVEVLTAIAENDNEVYWYRSSTSEELGTGLVFDPLNYIRAGETSNFYVKQAVGECFSPATDVAYTLRELPEAPVIEDETYCMDNPQKTVTASSSVNIEWIDYVTGELVATGDLYDFTDKISHSVNYTVSAVSVDDFGCRSETALRDIFIGAVPDPILIGEDIICALDENVEFKLVNTLQNSFIDWTSDKYGDLTLAEINNGTEISFVWDEPGPDKITVVETTGIGCSTETSLEILVAPQPVADFDYSRNEELVTFKNRSLVSSDASFQSDYIDSLTFTWNFDTNFSNDTIVGWDSFNEHINHIYDYGHYNASLRIDNKYGCSDEMTKNIFVELIGTLFIPNALAPDEQSEKVRTFKPIGVNLAEYKIYIYDAWGNTVWFSDALENSMPAEAWDGTFEGKKLKSDAYTWRIDAKFKSGDEWKGNKDSNGEYSKYGTVMLVR